MSPRTLTSLMRSLRLEGMLFARSTKSLSRVVKVTTLPLASASIRVTPAVVFSEDSQNTLAAERIGIH